MNRSRWRKLSGAAILLTLIIGILWPSTGLVAPATVSQRAQGPGQSTGNGIPMQVDQGVVGEPSTPTISPPVSDLPEYEDAVALDREMMRRDDHGFMGPSIDMPPFHNPLVDVQQAAVQQAAVEGRIDAFGTPLVNFSGYQTSSSPPDETGDVGPNHYLEGINGSTSVVRVFNKTGGVLKTFAMQSLASTAPCNSGYCDPVVLYDKAADRWLISEFPSNGNYFCVYVSTTSDPMGTWYAYTFGPMSQFPDYPKYAVWWDGYYISANNGGTVYVLDRNKMLNGQTATMQGFNIGTLPGFGFQLTMPAGLDGIATPPPSGAPGIFIRARDTEIHGPSGASTYDLMEMWQLHVDWTTPSNSTLTKLTDLHTAEFDQTLCGTGSDWSCMPQPGTSQQLDPIREPIHFPLQYRNWGSYETIVGCFAEDVDGTDHAAVHWFEMRKPSGGAWSIYQEGVLGGEANVHRSVCSAAMDAAGNIAVGYTRTGTASPYYPSIYYSGRLATDPLGTMPYYDNRIWDATNSKTNNERWGDYAGIGVDPTDDCTFWFTSEYGGSGATRVAALKFDNCGASDFTLDATPASLDVCAPNDAVYNVAVGQVGGFNGAVSLSAGGNPAGTTVSFTPNPATPPATSVLTIGNTGAAAPGTYSIVVTGVSGAQTHQDTVVLNLSSGAPAAPVLTAPANGATGVGTTPTFTWNAVNGAAGYELQVATDAGFANLVISVSGLAGTSYTPGSALAANTLYYWRVRAVGPCGTGAYSEVWSFTTVGMVCRTYTGATGSIKSRTTSSFNLVVPTGDTGTIVDVNVTRLAGTHSYVNYLAFNLRNPQGNQVTLIPASFCTGSGFNKLLDDEAGAALSCPLNNGATQRPYQALSAFDGRSSVGTWVLRITNSGRYTGKVTGWSLQICTQP